MTLVFGNGRASAASRPPARFRMSTGELGAKAAMTSIRERDQF
jgi:hypothetical protein